MKLRESSDDFHTRNIELDNPEKDVFNILAKKKTKLTTPSIIAYAKGSTDNPESLEITKLFVSENPSETLETEAEEANNAEHIFIHTNVDLEEGLVTEDKKKAVFDDYNKKVERIKRGSKTIKS